LIWLLALPGGWVLDDYSLLDPAFLHSLEWNRRPLSMLSFRFTAEIFGLEPWAFRLVNILIHMAAVQLCFRALRRLVGPERALLAAGVFAVHPLQSEAVLYVFARPVLLMGALLWWSLDRWLADKPTWAFAAFALALFAKEEAVAFPLLLAALHWAQKGDRNRWRWVGGMLALSALVMGSTLFITASIAGSGAGLQAGISPLAYLATQPQVIKGYVLSYFIPWGLAFDTAVTPAPLWAAAQGLLPLALLWKLRPDTWRFWVLAALLFLLPTSSVFPLADLTADRRVYMAIAMLALALPPQAKWALPVLILLSVPRALVWRDPKALWQEAMQASPEKLRPALQYSRYVSPEEGLQTLKAYASIGSNDAQYHTELGRIAMQQRDAARALGAFGQALALDPEKASHYYNRGAALLALGQREDAEADFRRALAIDPKHGPAQKALIRLQAK
jgi:protein O-mannosyl-transferase